MLQGPLSTPILERVWKIPIFDALRMRVDELSKGFCRATVPFSSKRRKVTISGISRYARLS